MAFVKRSQALQRDVAALQDALVYVPVAFWGRVLRRAALLPRHAPARFTGRAEKKHRDRNDQNHLRSLMKRRHPFRKYYCLHIRDYTPAKYKCHLPCLYESSPLSVDTVDPVNGGDIIGRDGNLIAIPMILSRYL